MTEIADINSYFERLYSEGINPPPITVDEFIDLMVKWKESILPKEKVRKIKLQLPELFLRPFRSSIKLELKDYLKNINITANIQNDNYF